MKLAVAQYEIEQLPNWQAYEDKIVRLVELAKEKEANLLALSEFAGIELAGWTQKTLKEQFEYIQTQLQAYQQLFKTLARDYQIYIQPGTLPVKEKDGYYRNRAFLFSQDGSMAYQDKLFLTPFEINLEFFKPGKDLRIFETALGKIGITISYDCEFPMLAHQLIHAGVKLILVPSCTEKMSGLTRVSICSQARAIENQCYVAQSSLVGKGTWSDTIDINTGQSGIYCPADLGFPEDGILAQAQLNTPMMIYADLSYEKLEHSRTHGEMRNFRDSRKEMTRLSESTSVMR